MPPLAIRRHAAADAAIAAAITPPLRHAICRHCADYAIFIAPFSHLNINNAMSFHHFAMPPRLNRQPLFRCFKYYANRMIDCLILNNAADRLPKGHFQPHYAISRPWPASAVRRQPPAATPPRATNAAASIAVRHQPASRRRYAEYCLRHNIASRNSHATCRPCFQCT